MNIVKQRMSYILSDWLAATLGWLAFYIYRYDMTGYLTFSSLEEFLTDGVVLLNLAVSPLLWLAIFSFSGFYARPFFKSHLEGLQTTFFSVLFGILCFFFCIVIDDVPLIDDERMGIMKIVHVSPRTYLQILLTMLVCVFVPVFLGRYFITDTVHRKMRRGVIGMRTLVVGDGKAARSLIRLVKQSGGGEYRLIGCLHLQKITSQRHDVEGLEMSAVSHVAYLQQEVEGIPVLGTMTEVASIVRQQDIDCFILAPDVRTQKLIYRHVYELMPFGKPIRMRAGDEEILAGVVRTRSLTSLPMLEFSTSPMTPFQSNVKRLFDILFSLFALLLCIPLFLALCVIIPSTSRGPIFYSQERVGRVGRKFRLWKFRSMVVNAEAAGPQLSSEGDARITRVGQFLRKYRIDELPQFWNVLRGDMSIVGPRPEREYYVQQIIDIAPYYTKLFQLRPGITSWGQVKYGYAVSVFQMVERMRYDLMYIENCSMLVDLKIICYTIRTVLTGKGI